ncbi:hypothetical protein E2C01_044974 [Portunus trituberculatus]|uniref:Uncharacterized protein n=1 Tax=Portunus trituberculatus TaxID=210409 RepID=A0A5B7G3S9_PORTR|nr:hypothetical protein [Portunus trituberculatus]
MLDPMKREITIIDKRSIVGYFLGTPYLKAHPSEEAQPTLGPWTGFEPVLLETPRTPKHAWFHCTTAIYKDLLPNSYPATFVDNYDELSGNVQRGEEHVNLSALNLPAVLSRLKGCTGAGIFNATFVRSQCDFSRAVTVFSLPAQVRLTPGKKTAPISYWNEHRERLLRLEYLQGIIS